MKFLNIIFLFYFISLSSHAYAYLDPGTGSIILTAIISFFALISFKLKFYINKIKNFFKKDKSKH